ncbi:MAG: PP2C family protein-serine/threonine phosphatase [Cellulomonas sp.]
MPYARPFLPLDPDSGPLAALTTLLRETHLSPPDAIPRALDAAAERLGARPVLYLSDYGDKLLVPFPGRHGRGREPLSVESSLAGRTYRTLECLPTGAEHPGQLWIPVVDGAERIGVVELTMDDPRILHDPTFRRHCWWVAHYLGHLVSALDRMGDGIDEVRRHRSRTIAAELIWQLLPPLTAGTGKVVVSGRLEPSDDVGGDVFDYALSDRTAACAIFDATGHDLRSGLGAATALAAYRNARRQGHGLLGQAETIDRILVEQFAGQLYATGILATLDLDSGWLRYLTAGHHPPLLVREGRVVKALQGGRRAMLGRESRSVEVGEEHLQPGDILALYTDGITEARGTDGALFGLDRLVDLLQREVTAGAALPEVARRLTRRILEHQRGVLQDDATVLLVQWTTEGRASLEPTPRW